MPDPKSLHNPPLAEQSRSPTVVASGSPVLVYHPCGSNGTVQPFAAKKRRLEFDDINDSRLRKTINSCLETFIQTMIAETKALVIEEIVESTSHWCSLIENHDEEVKEKLERVNRSFAMMDARMMALEKETNESKSSIATLKEEAKQYKEDIRRMRFEEMTSKQEIEGLMFEKLETKRGILRLLTVLRDGDSLRYRQEIMEDRFLRVMLF
ncbi:hypothetical protein E8E14_000746 [Neopestalotiopsis sp. 37M]|nr:hypothetical protein E8E14_000746 [Neopestalotiopsis sp. 37M]